MILTFSKEEFDAHIKKIYDALYSLDKEFGDWMVIVGKNNSNPKLTHMTYDEAWQAFIIKNKDKFNLPL